MLKNNTKIFLKIILVNMSFLLFSLCAVAQTVCTAEDKQVYEQYKDNILETELFGTPQQVDQLIQQLRSAIPSNCLTELEHEPLPETYPNGGSVWGCEQAIANYRSCKRRQNMDITLDRAMRYCPRPPQRCGPY